MNTYNGWANYPTWNVKLWIDNDQGLASYANEIAAASRNNGPMAIGEAVRDALDELFSTNMPTSGFVADIWDWAWGQIDWREIGESLLEDLPEDEDEE